MQRPIRQGRNNNPGCNLSPLEASFIISLQAEASFPSKGSSHCPLPRELTDWFLLHSPIATSIWMLMSPLIPAPQTCLGGLSQQHLRLQTSSPPKERALSGHFLPPIRQFASMSFIQHPSLSSYPGRDWGRGLRSVQGPQEQPGRGVCSYPRIPVFVLLSASIPPYPIVCN